MTILKKKAQDGISLRKTHGILTFLAITSSFLLIISTFHSARTFTKLSRATDEYIDLQGAAYELLEASDYLTEMAQRFTVDGKVEYLENYFREAFETARREDAVNRMSKYPENKEALEKLQSAMDSSMHLMKKEYYAMRLVIEAGGNPDSYPSQLDGVRLNEKDAALSSRDKLDLARNMMLGDSYYEEKDLIRENMKESLLQLEKTTRSQQKGASSDLQKEIDIVRIVIVIQVLGILLMIWLTSKLGISPVLKAVEKIQDDKPIPVIGANEFRYLARTYNKMYDVYKSSLARLNYKASHDELTKVYNRSGYDLLLSSLDFETTFLLILDVDNFKSINDSFGHETGDRILVKMVETVRRHFRDDDYICRIGGDEFVIFMVHSFPEQQNQIRMKVNRINAELSSPEDGLPPVSISVGAAHGKDAADAEDCFDHADKALYTIKRGGKNGVAFYQPSRKK